MAVRSWPPSSAITMRPPARPMSSWVSRPKPANAQSWRSRNTSQHSTIMSKKCCGYPEVRMRCSHLAETLYPPSGDWWPSTASKPADTRTTSGLKCWAMGITTYLYTHPVQWKSAQSIRSVFYTPAVRQSLALFYCCITSFLTPEMHIFDVYLKAVRYSTSPMGGSTPPVHAMFTLKPLPPPDPTCRDTGWQQRITLSHCLGVVVVHAL